MKKIKATKILFRFAYKAIFVVMGILSLLVFFDLELSKEKEFHPYLLLPNDFQESKECSDAVSLTLKELKDNRIKVDCYGTLEFPTKKDYPFYTSVITSNQKYITYFKSIIEKDKNR